MLDRSFYLEPDQVVTFAVQDAVIVYWFDTGELAGSEILQAASGSTTWSKSPRGLSFNLTREALEQERAALAAQPVSV